MTNKEFLKAYPLERHLPTKETKIFKKILKEVSTEFRIFWNVEKSYKLKRLQYWKIVVYCDNKSFADAYARIGALYGKKVTPVWQSRFKK